jgi:hypothetical protein
MAAPAEVTYRVKWWIFEGHHDWVGPRQRRKRKRIQPPAQQTADFDRREDAEALRQDLRERWGDEAVVQIVAVNAPPPRLPSPTQTRFPGADGWPTQYSPWVIRPKAEEVGDGR